THRRGVWSRRDFLQLLSGHTRAAMVWLSAGDSVVRFSRDATAWHSFVCIRHHATDLRVPVSVIHTAVLSVVDVHHCASRANRSSRSLVDWNCGVESDARDRTRHPVLVCSGVSRCLGAIPLWVARADLSDLLPAPAHLLSG